MSFDTELEAFRAYAEIYPDSCFLLVDTYDTLKSGVPNAIIVGKELEANGKKLLGIRLDSGDIAMLSREARKMLDESGLKDTKILASNDLDEYAIEEIRRNKGSVDLWGIGTKLATCYDQPALGAIFKLVAMDNKPKIKIAETIDKTTIPSKKQVHRIYDKEGFMRMDVIQLLEKKTPEEDVVYDPVDSEKSYQLPDSVKTEPLLKYKMKKGKLLEQTKTWQEARKVMEEDISHLDETLKILVNPSNYPVCLSRSLHDLRIKLIHHYIGKNVEP
jgi:nicotinate phosphoribosyltransferase